MLKIPSQLTDDEIKDIMEKYYSGDITASSIIKEYNLDVSPSRLFTLFPNIICEEICPWCEANLEIPAPSRTEMNTSYKNKIKTCPYCGHKISRQACSCNKCVEQAEKERKIECEKKEQERQYKILLINTIYKHNPQSYRTFEDLDFLDRVYLGALLRGYLSEDLSTINPVNPNELSANGTLSNEIINRLYSKRIICVDSSSDISAFSEDEGVTFPHTFYTYHVKYYLNMDLTSNKQQLISQFLFPKEITTSEEKELAYTLWKRIAIEDCIEYLLYQLRKVKFEFSPGDKTYTVFEELLQHFSVTQIYNIIWRKVSDAARLYQEGNMSRKHAANTVISGCQSYGERARLNNWDISKYHRPYDLPQSVLSEFFFNQVLHIGEMGNNMPPTIP